MDREQYLTQINAPGIGAFGVEWETTVKPAAAHRAHTLRKVTTAMVMTGVEYANLAVNNDRETGELPWGEWAMYPYVITHKGADYFRLYTVDHTVRTTYMVDGEVTDRETFNGYLTPSQAAAKRPHGGCITVKAANLHLVGDASVAA